MNPTATLVIALAGVLLALAPSAHAHDAAVLTIADPEGDVSYHPAHVGSNDHDYLDLRHLWIVPDNQTGDLLFILQLTDLSAVEPPPSDWVITWMIRATTMLGDEAGRLIIYVDGGGGRELTSNAMVGEASSPFRQIPHQFDYEFTPMGNFTISISAGTLRNHADVIREVSISSNEYPVYAGLLLLPTNNGDRAEADPSDYVDLYAHVSGPAYGGDDGDEIGPIPEGGRQSLYWDEGGDSPSIGGLWGASAIAWASFLAMRRFRRANLK